MLQTCNFLNVDKKEALGSKFMLTTSLCDLVDQPALNWKTRQFQYIFQSDRLSSRQDLPDAIIFEIACLMIY